MGNTATKEARGYGHSDSANGRPERSTRHTHAPHSSPRHRAGRNDGSFWNLGIGYDGERPNVVQHKETRQEREARKAERERAARVSERERSTKEEHVDGGFLVALGIYVGAEDWNKAIVRRLIVERKLAPYWKGLTEFDEHWTEHQIMAAVRDLPIPPPDQVPPELDHNALQKNPFPNDIHNTRHNGERATTKSNADNLTFSSILAHSTSNSSPHHDSSRLQSKSATSNDEIRLPHDPYFNGQPLEVYLYKSGAECPICFLYYPTFLNSTSCCHQPLCSECFVKIKRPEPHHAEHHPHNTENSSAVGQERSSENGNTDNNDEIDLVTEPASCPYCTIPEFGVVYTPPPFRRGLAYASNPFTQYPQLPSGLSQSGGGADASPHTPTVVSTDMIRPDWSEKLQNVRDQAARRAAAATAIHTAAYMMNDGSSRARNGRSRLSTDAAGNSNNERPFTSLISRRVLRAATGHAHSPRHDQHQDGATSIVTRTRNQSFGSGNGNGDERQASEDSGLQSSRPRHNELVSALAASGVAMPTNVINGRPGQPRAEELEEMMLREAVRQSLASEEERKKKEEELEKKEEEEKEKEKRKLSAQSQTVDGAETQAGPSQSPPVEQITRSSGPSLDSKPVARAAEEAAPPPGK